MVEKENFSGVKFPVVGYGSLLSHKSLRETIKDKSFRRVLVKGYRRVFNLMEEGGDVLNLEKFDGVSFNGVLFFVDEGELKKLKIREDEYNLEKVGVFDFDDGEKICDAYVSIDYVVGIDDGKRLPNKDYFILCRFAAYELGEDFGKFWDETTYLSSGEKVCDWLRENLDFAVVNC